MFSCKNNNQGGLFANVFFRNMITYLLSIKYNTGSEYEKIPKHYDLPPHYQWKTDDFLELGVEFKDENIHPIKNSQQITDTQIKQFLDGDLSIDKSTKYIFNPPCWCQDSGIVKHITHYFANSENELCDNIISRNKYKDRYKNNNDMFIHIRANHMYPDSHPLRNIVLPDQAFYEGIIDSLNDEYSNIYMSSDNIEHKICQGLIKKYKIIPFVENKIDTILFGSTCKYVIISSGSFSFMIGLFSFFSEKIFYHKRAGQGKKMIHPRLGLHWHGWHPNFYPTLITPKYKKI
jgi:hypothetical protein